MLISLYLLSVLYTNSMGVIILSRCNPIINKQIEEKGYKKKEISDSELTGKIIKDCLLFLIPGYYLKKALDMTSKDTTIEKIIEDKVNDGEFESATIDEYTSEDIPNVDSIFKKESKLSLGKYERTTPYKAISNQDSMYTDIRYPNSEDIDMDFWEEEEKDIAPYLEETVVEDKEIKSEPMQEYLESISEDELLDMARQLEMIRKLKKDNEKFLNNNAA